MADRELLCCWPLSNGTCGQPAEQWSEWGRGYCLHHWEIVLAVRDYGRFANEQIIEMLEREREKQREKKS